MIITSGLCNSINFPRSSFLEALPTLLLLREFFFFLNLATSIIDTKKLQQGRGLESSAQWMAYYKKSHEVKTVWTFISKLTSSSTQHRFEQSRDNTLDQHATVLSVNDTWTDIDLRQTVTAQNNT